MGIGLGGELRSLPFLVPKIPTAHSRIIPFCGAVPELGRQRDLRNDTFNSFILQRRKQVPRQGSSFPRSHGGLGPDPRPQTPDSCAHNCPAWATSLWAPASSYSSRGELQRPPQFQGAPFPSIPLPRFRGGGLHPPPVVGGGSIPLPQFQGAPSPSHFLLFSVEAFPMESCLRGAACQGPELPFRMRQVTKSLVWEKLTEPFCEELVTIKIKYSPPAGLGSRERNHRVLVPIITETLA